jgi:capsular polysaccharide biosynthesis protein
MSPAKQQASVKKPARRGRRSAAKDSTPAIYKYNDAIELPAVDRDHLDAGMPAAVFVEPPGKMRRFPRSAPEFISDPDHVGLFSRFGADTITSPPVFVAAARNARVVGFRTILTENGLFFNDDSVSGPRQRRQFLMDLAGPYPGNEENGFRAADKIDRFFLDPGERPTQRIKKTTVVLCTQEPSNYGSWLFRTLPKLHSLAQINLRQPLRYLVWAGFPAFYEYLDLLGISEDLIIHHDPSNVIYDLDKAIIPSVRNNQAYLDPESVALFAKLRARLGGPVQPGARIYVSRVQHSQSEASARVMLNEPELVERLVDLRFRIVEPETLSVAEQILAFSSAEMVVGPSGSGMFNVVFCHPGTKVIDIESEPHWIHAHRCLFASCGLRYGIFVGRALDRDFEVHHKPWKVNIDALIAQIMSFAGN